MPNPPTPRKAPKIKWQSCFHLPFFLLLVYRSATASLTQSSSPHPLVAIFFLGSPTFLSFTGIWKCRCPSLIQSCSPHPPSGMQIIVDAQDWWDILQFIVGLLILLKDWMPTSIYTFSICPGPLTPSCARHC